MHQSKFKQLLFSVEADKSSCCIKVASFKNKKKGIILIFRGRAVGCTYGHKSLEEQVFGHEAFKCILADLDNQNDSIDAFLLSDDLVLAAGALFNGEIFHKDSANNVAGFKSVHSRLIQSGTPGCIVVKSSEEKLIANIYFFGGQMIGIHSNKKGWVSTSYERAMYYVVNTPRTKVLASKWDASNIEEVMNVSFSPQLDDPKNGQEHNTLKEPFLLDLFGKNDGTVDNGLQ